MPENIGKQGVQPKLVGMNQWVSWAEDYLCLVVSST